MKYFSLTVPRRFFCHGLFLWMCVSLTYFVLDCHLAFLWESSCPFGSLIVMFPLGSTYFVFVFLSLWCLWWEVWDNCIGSWSLPFLLFLRIRIWQIFPSPPIAAANTFLAIKRLAKPHTRLCAWADSSGSSLSAHKVYFLISRLRSYFMMMYGHTCEWYSRVNLTSDQNPIHLVL